MKRLLAALTGVVLLAVPAGAAAAVDITQRQRRRLSAHAGDRRHGQADAAAAGIDGERAYRPPGSSPTTSATRRASCLLVDNSRSMKGAPLEERDRRCAGIRRRQGPERQDRRHRLRPQGRRADRALGLRQRRLAARSAASSSTRSPERRSSTRSRSARSSSRRSRRAGKVILLVTDGKDVSSDASFPDAVKAAHEAGALVYGIGISESTAVLARARCAP